MTLLPLNPDELLSTTRAVRKRLDFDRPVPDELIRECVALAMQPPSGSNNMTMQFVVVRDAAKRAAIGEIYRQCYAIYSQMEGVYIGSIDKGEQQVAQVVGIPFDSVQQVCLSPLAFTVGTDFKPAARPPADSIIHWDQW